MPDQQPPATRIARLTDCGMITLRGDLADETFRKALGKAAGLELPATGKISARKGWALAWMAPDEILFLMPASACLESLATLEAKFEETTALAVDTSSLRTLFRVRGPDVRDVLAHETPTNLSPQAFAPGDFRRSRFGQVAAAFWLEQPDDFRLVCRTSEADYVEALLAVSAAGPRVGFLS